jgi:macrolide transport system ATP-binding/permease protein
MLIVENISKSYGPFMVLCDVSFSLYRGMRAGLVGANGGGKSTLLKIITGYETADSGSMSLTRGTKIGYLPQVLPDYPGKTIDGLIEEASVEIKQMEVRLHAAERQMGKMEGPALEALLAEYGAVLQKYEDYGGYEHEHRVAVVLEGLGVSRLERSREIKTLSGGEKTRLSLALVLLGAPDLLLLDEPTNHLDKASLEWLEDYLKNFPGGVVISSHDRQLLNTAVNWIFQLDEHSHTLTKYAGNYDAYRSAGERERQQQAAAYQAQQAEISELKKTIRTHRTESNRHLIFRDRDKFAMQFKKERMQAGASRGIGSARERLDRILADPLPPPAAPLRFRTEFTAASIRSAEVIAVSRVSKAYGGKEILREISFTLGPDTRAVITGPNGSGKTTLLRILAGAEAADSGSIVYSPSLKPGYLPQEFLIPDSNASVLEYYVRGRAGCREDLAAELLQSGLFRFDELPKPVGRLSPGQMRKLDIARLVALAPNTLLLDEPTNYISLDDLEAFEAALALFPGPVLAVSHDRRFIRQFGGAIWELSGGVLAFDK